MIKKSRDLKTSHYSCDVTMLFYDAGTRFFYVEPCQISGILVAFDGVISWHWCKNYLVIKISWIVLVRLYDVLQ